MNTKEIGKYGTSLTLFRIVETDLETSSSQVVMLTGAAAKCTSCFLVFWTSNKSPIS